MARSRPRTDDGTERERSEFVQQLEDALEMPMLVLGFVWLVLMVVELVRGTGPVLEIAITVIWIVFLLEFGLRFLLAPRKLRFLAGSWLTLIALAVPALRVFRIARAVRLLRVARAVRGVRLVRVLATMNRGMRSLRASLGRHGFGYVVSLTLLVVVAGAAGIYAFEREASEGRIDSFGSALWWTAMVVTTLGSEYWPRTPEGRVLCLILALYAFAVFGYITATLASWLVERDAANDQTPVAGRQDVHALSEQVAALREEIRRLRESRA